MSNLKYPISELNSKLAKRMFISNLEECERFPKYFEVETVNACNARCTMCTINDWDKKSDVIMKMEMFESFAKELSKHSDWVEHVCLNRNGEPTLDKKLYQRIKLLKDAKIKKVTFATNAQLLDQSFIEKILDAGLDEIMVSIDGITKEVFEKIRIRLAFETVLKNTLNLIEIRNTRVSPLKIRIRMVVVNENKHEVKPFIDFWKSRIDHTLDDIYAMEAHTWGNQLASERAEKIKYYADKPCISPFSTMIIHADGSVPLCGVDYNTKYLLGKFPQNSIQEIWQGEKYTEIRTLHANKKRNTIDFCQGCSIWDRPIYGEKKDTDREIVL